jgi:hypothetical protein
MKIKQIQPKNASHLLPMIIEFLGNQQTYKKDDHAQHAFLKDVV